MSKMTCPIITQVTSQAPQCHGLALLFATLPSGIWAYDELSFLLNVLTANVVVAQLNSGVCLILGRGRFLPVTICWQLATCGWTVIR